MTVLIVLILNVIDFVYFHEEIRNNGIVDFDSLETDRLAALSGREKQLSPTEIKARITPAHEIWAHWEKLKSDPDTERLGSSRKNMPSDVVSHHQATIESQQPVTKTTDSLEEWIPAGW